MMSEAQLWDKVRNAMGGRWHAQRHEDKHSKGIADVSYGVAGADGWIELKVVERFETNPDGMWDFSLHKFPPEQRNWLRQRAKFGSGRVFLMSSFGDKLILMWRWSDLQPLLAIRRFAEIRKKACLDVPQGVSPGVLSDTLIQLLAEP